MNERCSLYTGILLIEFYIPTAHYIDIILTVLKSSKLYILKNFLLKIVIP